MDVIIVIKLLIIVRKWGVKLNMKKKLACSFESMVYSCSGQEMLKSIDASSKKEIKKRACNERPDVI
ncbi:hypothetical protein AWJ19_18670 [Paenibacillus sp. DMB5]|nr:hypothetical protein AWJ19_18670 [Paenibacillus sp. DMB5]